MKTKARIASIRQAHTLDESITGIPTFKISTLKGVTDLAFPLPTNLRLGHLVERIVSEWIKTSSNYCLLHENVQLLEGKITIGELDFLMEEIDSKQLIHMELAYKFYLFDPSISNKPMHNWIGPNRNDSLREKLEKLKTKQFPLLFDKRSQTQLRTLNLVDVKQQLCFLVSLFIPYQNKVRFNASYKKAIVGYYLNWERFKRLDHANISYHIPSKKEWGIDPSENDQWTDFYGVEEDIAICIVEKQAPLVWRKFGERFEVFFVTWW